MKWELEDYPEDVRRRLIKEVKNYLKYRDPGGWGASALKALLIEIQLLEEKIKELKEKKNDNPD